MGKFMYMQLQAPVLSVGLAQQPMSHPMCIYWITSKHFLLDRSFVTLKPLVHLSSVSSETRLVGVTLEGKYSLLPFCGLKKLTQTHGLRRCECMKCENLHFFCIERENGRSFAETWNREMCTMCNGSGQIRITTDTTEQGQPDCSLRYLARLQFVLL